jgi:hypothetical protein
VAAHRHSLGSAARRVVCRPRKPEASPVPSAPVAWLDTLRHAPTSNGRGNGASARRWS